MGPSTKTALRVPLGLLGGIRSFSQDDFFHLVARALWRSCGYQYHELCSLMKGPPNGLVELI